MKKNMNSVLRGLVFLSVFIFTFVAFIQCNNSKQPVNKQTGTKLTKTEQNVNSETSQKEGIIYPINNQCVQKGSIEIKWNPADTPMVIQYYQHEQCMLNCPSGPAALSGEIIMIDKIGETEIKIWKKNADKPFSSIWVYVKESCPPK